MANIENRRIKRRIGVIAAAVCGLLAVAAIVLAALLLPKSCSDPRKQEGKGTAEPTASAPFTDVPTASPAAAETAAPSPVVTPRVGADEPSASAVPVQTTEDRSSILIVMTVGSENDRDDGYIRGSAAVTFVNNTDQPMYSAYLSLGGFAVTSASVNGSAARYYSEDGGALRLPFVNELLPGQSAELYFEFTASASGDSIAMPVPAYDTVCDIVCFVFTQGGISASSGSVETAGDGALRVEAEGVRELSLYFADLPH